MMVSVVSMAGLAIVFAGMLAFADRKLKVEEDPLIDEANHLLPGLNCGGCGYAGCHAFAEAMVAEGASPSKCPVMHEDSREKLFALLGEDEETSHPRLPFVRCAAEKENKEPIADYVGIRTCRSAKLAFGGGMQCEYGCMGFGDCTKVCPFDAFHMEKGLPRVDQEKCTGCGKCAEACPRDVIVMKEKAHEKAFYVACCSHDDALRVRQICGVGCIGCGICAKLSQKGFFAVENNLATADHTKQLKEEFVFEIPEVETLKDKCPTKVIKEI